MRSAVRPRSSISRGASIAASHLWSIPPWSIRPSSAAPRTAGAPIKSVRAAFSDYVVELSANGGTVYSTLFGGSEGNTYGGQSGIAVDEFGKAFITGQSNSPFLPTVKPLRLYQDEKGFVFKTLDGGNSSSNLGWTPSIGSATLIAVDPSTTPSTIYVGTTRNGLYVSTDGGSTFQATALSEVPVYGLAIDQTTVPPTVYAGTPEGLVMLTDVGTTFLGTAFDGLVVGTVAVNVVSGNSVVIASTSDGVTNTVMTSSDHGNTFVPSTGIPSNLFAYSFTQHAGTAFELAGTQAGVFKSTNRGATWVATNLSYPFVNVLTTDNKTSPPTDYAGTVGDGLIKSTDGFTTLNFPSVPALDLSVYALEKDESTTPTTIYLGGAEIGFAEFFRSTDGGNNFVFMPGNGDGQEAIITLAKDPKSAAIYFATFHESDPFVAELNATGTAFLFSTYLGGSNGDLGNAIAVNAVGLNAYVVGQTFSPDFPVHPNPGAEQVTFGGFENAFAARISLPLSATIISNDTDFKALDAIATDGTKLYVSGTSTATNAARIWSVPIAGGAATALYSVPWTSSGGCCALSLAVIPTNLFWIDPNSGPVTDTQILKAPTSGAGPVGAIYTGSAVGQPIVDGSGLTTDGTKLYAADEVGGGVFSMNADGSSLTQIGAARYAGGSTTEHPNFVVAAGSTIYIADQGSPANSLPARILKLPAAGGAYTTLYSGAPLNCPSGITFGDGALFIADHCAKLVWAMPTSGGRPSVLIGSPLAAPDMAVFFGGSLYVTDNSTTGRIFKVSGF